MAIQMRRGNNAYYDESKMKPGEVAVATDTRQVYVGMGNGDAEELALKRDLEGFDSGTTDHTQLTNRDAADQHPIESIRGLRAELDEQRIIATATGESIVLTDSSDKPLEGLVLYGKTTQNGTPSPTNPIPLVSSGDDGEITAQVSGKNLQPMTATSRTVNGITFTVNSDKSISVSGTANANADIDISGSYGSTDVCVLPGQYIFAKTGAERSNDAVLLYGFGTSQSGYLTNTNQRVNLDNGISWIRLRVNSGKTVDFTYYPMICLASIADGTYEPYKESQTLAIQTPNDLTGIPVTSGGNYTDENGQQWACDEIDFVRGVYVQRCGTINSYDGESIDTPYISSTGELSAGAEVIYALTEPVETSLTAAEIAAYKALHSNKPVTTILNDGDAGMAVSYVADTKAYIDNKFAALEAAILSTGGNV